MKKLLIVFVVLMLASCDKMLTQDTNPTGTGEVVVETQTPAPEVPADPNAVVKNGDKVEVHYKGTLEDGTVFDESYPKNQTLPFTVGTGQMIKGFDAAVVGMKVGEKKTVTLTSAEAYGEYDKAKIIAIPRSQLGEDGKTLKAGDKLYDQSGRPAPILSTTETEVMVDTNHELAGKTLIFEIEMMKIN